MTDTNQTPDPWAYCPMVRDADWPALVEVAERRGIPVLRVDHCGEPHLIRSVAQLRAEWDDEPTTERNHR